MLSRLSVTISDGERKALQALAEYELRGINEQARLIIRRDLERRGLLGKASALGKQEKLNGGEVTCVQ